ncbi:MAG: TlpA disulfide reductase family protein [Saprospiraceae bacterium]|nr:TlpA disulfide reductase family protein [Saprospiraceae bacterium]
MRVINIILIFFVSSQFLAQEMSFDIDEHHIDPFGKNSDLVGFIPLFELSSDYLHSKNQSNQIVRLPASIDKVKTAYGFISFSGLKNSMFNKEIALLVEHYTSSDPVIYLDRNGNLDFNDDGLPLTLHDELIVQLANEDDSSAYYHYQIGRSKITDANEAQLRNRYASKFPQNAIVSAKNWLTSRRLSVRVSNDMLEEKPITIFLLDNSVDGLFTFQTDEYGDRILVVEGEIDENQDLTSILRQAQPIDHNAVFELYGNNYFIKHASRNGNEVILAVTSQKTGRVFKDGEDISDFAIPLLDGKTTAIKDLLQNKKYLLIDVGGTWCGGCIKQEPTIKRIYESGQVGVVGLFDHDTPKSVRKYIVAHDIKWPVALVDATFKTRFNITSFPTYILVTPQGKIILFDSNSEAIEKYLSD